MSDTIQSREYKPNPAKCCEKCVFGTGKHSEFCESREAKILRVLASIPPLDPKYADNVFVSK